jgi:hypothetical protein
MSEFTIKRKDFNQHVLDTKIREAKDWVEDVLNIRIDDFMVD